MLQQTQVLPLKEATAEKHKQAERMPFNVAMFRGMLTPQQYLVYLEQQQAIFSVLEQEALPSNLLLRSKALETDIRELIETGCSLQGILPETQAYVDYLQQCDATQRDAHIYLNYLALLFGGQMMSSKVPSSGKFYNFEDPAACILAIRQRQQDTWAEEVNKGFDFAIAQFEALAKACSINL